MEFREITMNQNGEFTDLEVLHEKFIRQAKEYGNFMLSIKKDFATLKVQNKYLREENERLKKENKELIKENKELEENIIHLGFNMM